MTGPQLDRAAPPLFILEGNDLFRNRGCEAIFRSTVALLREEFGACRIVNAPRGREDPTSPDDVGPDVTSVPPLVLRRWTPAWLAFQARWRLLGRKTFAFERYLPEAAAVLAVGGDNYTLDYGVPTGFFEANEATLRRGKPLILWGASIGPFSANPAFERQAAEALRRVTLICARETETVSYLSSIGVRENVRLVADPAFVLEPRPVEDDPVLCDRLSKPCLGVNLSPLAGAYAKGGDWTGRAAACVGAILAAVDLPVVLIPHVMGQGINDDAAFLAEVRSRCTRHADRILVVDRRYGAAELKWIISRLGGLVAARTHATIAGFSTGVPTLSVGYSMKARGINRDLFGCLDWLIPVAELEPDRLSETVRRMLAAGDAIRARLAEQIPVMKSRARSAAALVRQIVERTGGGQTVPADGARG